jgi:hypothetical protein
MEKRKEKDSIRGREKVEKPVTRKQGSGLQREAFTTAAQVTVPWPKRYFFIVVPAK